jgi:uncharacterized phage protein gp47/JayE
MFEAITYEVILQRMIARVEEWARGRSIGIDTREGSLIRTALSPAAAELGQMYLALDEVLNESFADTETRDFLIRRCRERGIFVEPATYAIRRGDFNMSVPIGARFSLNKLNYAAVIPIGGNAFQMRCETAGNIGNIESGALIPIDYIDGLTSAVLTDVLIPGEDEEATEHLRMRYMSSLNAQAYGGNIQDYVEKTLSVAGVGGVKVYPVWDGGGTVKLVILDSQFNAPSPTLIDAVQATIDPVTNQGAGLGVAPIGHIVTVTGAGAVPVDIRTHITFKDGWNWDAVRPYLEALTEVYFTELAEGWDKVDWREYPADGLIVRISQLETRFLTAPGVLDIADTELNGVAANLLLGAEDIPARGVISNA